MVKNDVIWEMSVKGGVKDRQRLLKDPENNTPLEEEQFSKVQDERVSLRRNFRKVRRP
jgi:hypothetical protein